MKTNSLQLHHEKSVWFPSYSVSTAVITRVLALQYHSPYTELLF